MIKLNGMDKSSLNKYLENTIGAIDSIALKIKLLDAVRVVATYMIYTAYLVYRLATGSGYFILNICLLALTFSYGVFAITCKIVGNKIVGKKTEKIISTIYTVLKRIFAFVGLGITVYSILITVEHYTAMNLVSSILSGICTCMQVIFDVIVALVASCLETVKDAITADINNFVDTHEKGINTVKSVVNGTVKVVGFFSKASSLKRKLLPQKKQKEIAVTEDLPSLPDDELSPSIDTPMTGEVSAASLADALKEDKPLVESEAEACDSTPTPSLPEVVDDALPEATEEVISETVDSREEDYKAKRENPLKKVLKKIKRK